MDVSWTPSCLAMVFIIAIFPAQALHLEAIYTSEGEIPLEIEDDIKEESLVRVRRKAFRATSSRWPNAIIPYVIDGSVYNISIKAVDAIQDAMKHWSAETCIQFEKYNQTKHGQDFLSIKTSSWCESQLSRLGGEQHLYMNRKCAHRGTMIHELGHTVGLIHEHNRPDRDEHIIIQWHRVKVKHYNYKKRTRMQINTYGLPYDFKSVMQYRALDDELLAKDPRNQHFMGQRKALSFLDKKLTNLMYDCNKSCPKTIPCHPPGFVNFQCRCICPEEAPSCATHIQTSLGDKTTQAKNHTICRWSYHRGLLVDAPLSNALVVQVQDFQECKIRCLEEQAFRCLSVHYEITRNPWKKAKRKCYLQKTAGKPGKLRFIRKSRMYHMDIPLCIQQAEFCGWEKQDNTTLYPDDQLSKITYGLTLNECKINCLEESSFRCRSLMYRWTNKTNSVCIHTSRRVGSVGEDEYGTVPGVMYYERKRCKGHRTGQGYR